MSHNILAALQTTATIGKASNGNRSAMIYLCFSRLPLVSQSGHQNCTKLRQSQRSNCTL